MPETGQSEWNAQALVAAGAVLLLLTALWLGVYAPGQKKLSDDFLNKPLQKMLWNQNRVLS